MTINKLFEVYLLEIFFEKNLSNLQHRNLAQNFH